MFDASQVSEAASGVAAASSLQSEVFSRDPSSTIGVTAELAASVVAIEPAAEVEPVASAEEVLVSVSSQSSVVAAGVTAAAAEVVDDTGVVVTLVVVAVSAAESLAVVVATYPYPPSVATGDASTIPIEHTTSIDIVSFTCIFMFSAYVISLFFLCIQYLRLNLSAVVRKKR